MLKNRPLVILLTAIALVGFGSTVATLVLAGDAPAGPPGSLTVTIVDVKGQPAPSIKFGLYALADPGKVHGGGGGGGTKMPVPNFVFDIEEPTQLQKGIGKAVFSGMSDVNGVVEIKSVAAGNYQFRCGNTVKGVKSGPITIEPGKQQTLSVKLEPPKKAA